MGLIYVLNKDYKEVMQQVNAHPENGLRVVHQPQVDGKESLWPWGLTHEDSETFAWFEGFYLHTWGSNVGKGNEIINRLRPLGIRVEDTF